MTEIGRALSWRMRSGVNCPGGWQDHHCVYDLLDPSASFSSRHSKLLVTTLTLQLLRGQPRLSTLACVSKLMNFWPSRGKPALIVVVDALDESDCGTDFLEGLLCASQLARVKW